MKISESPEFVQLNSQLINEVDAGNVSLEALEAFLNANKSSVEVAKPKWTVTADGMIAISGLVSDGASGPQALKNLQDLGFRVGDCAKSMLLSKDYKPSLAGTVHDVIVMRGTDFNDSDRITKKIRAKAKKLGFLTPNAEVAYLLRKNFSDEDLKAMGLLWIMVMHDAIEDFDGDPLLLNMDCYDEGPWLLSNCGKPGSKWSVIGGFAFVRQQVSSGT